MGREALRALDAAMERAARRLSASINVHGARARRLAERLDRLDAAQLEPARGLGALFNGRAARLKRLKDRLAGASRLLTDGAAVLSEQAAGVQARLAGLEDAYDEVRACLMEALAWREAAPAERRDRFDQACRRGLRVLTCLRGAQNVSGHAEAACQTAREALEAFARGWRDLLADPKAYEQARRAALTAARNAERALDGMAGRMSELRGRINAR